MLAFAETAIRLFESTLLERSGVLMIDWNCGLEMEMDDSWTGYAGWALEPGTWWMWSCQ